MFKPYIAGNAWALVCGQLQGKKSKTFWAVGTQNLKGGIPGTVINGDDFERLRGCLTIICLQGAEKIIRSVVARHENTDSCHKMSLLWQTGHLPD